MAKRPDPILTKLEQHVKEYADAQKALLEKARDLDKEIERLKRKHVKTIKAAAIVFSVKRSRLVAQIEDHRDFFKKPRTRLINGVKIGYQKGKGELTWKSESYVVEKIKQMFGAQAGVLIKTTEKPVKSALDKLTTYELKRLGITVKNTGDKIVIKSADSEAEKMINALLRDAQIALSK